VNEKVHRSRASGGFDALGAVDEVAGPRFHAETVERVLAKRGFGALAEVGGNGYGVRLERALERGLQLALGIGGVELGASDSNPGATAGCTGADVGRNASVRAKGEPD
jgi:hypothetical protein